MEPQRVNTERKDRLVDAAAGLDLTVTPHLVATSRSLQTHFQARALLTQEIIDLGLFPRLATGFAELLVKVRTPRAQELIHNLCEQYKAYAERKSGTETQFNSRSYTTDATALGLTTFFSLVVDHDKVLAELLQHFLKQDQRPSVQLVAGMDNFCKGFLFNPRAGEHAHIIGALLKIMRDLQPSQTEIVLFKSFVAPIFSVFANSQRIFKKPWLLIQLSGLNLISAGGTSVWKADFDKYEAILPKKVCDAQMRNFSRLTKQLLNDAQLMTEVQKDFFATKADDPALSSLIRNNQNHNLLNVLQTFVSSENAITDNDFCAILENIPLGLNWGLNKPEEKATNWFGQTTVALLQKYGYGKWAARDFEPSDLNILIKALSLIRVVHDRSRLESLQPQIINKINCTCGFGDLKAEFKVQVQSLAEVLLREALSR